MMTPLVILLSFLTIASIAYLWATGISDMHEEHYDYDGEDWFEDYDEWEEE